MNTSSTVRFLLRSAVLAAAAFVLPLGLSHQTFAQQPPAKKKVTQVKEPKKHLPNDTVGVVNGEVITYRDFNGLMSGYLKIFIRQTPDNIITDSLYSVIVDSAWNKAVSDIIIESEIQKRQLSMNDSAVRETLIADPPPFFRDQFLDAGGHFQAEQMRRALTDPRNDSITAVILAGERVRLETDRLIGAVVADSGKPSRSAAERQRVFDTWLRKASAKAKILDRRLSFGFY